VSRLLGHARALLVASALFACAMTAFAEPPPASSAIKRDLPDLPRAPPLEPSDPVPADLTEIDELVQRISSEDAAARDDGVRRIVELGPKVVPAVRRHIERLAKTADTTAMKRLLGDIRRQASADSDDEPDAGPGHITELQTTIY
jgi:hypothetical protein